MQTKTALETIIRMAEAGEFGIADVAKRALAEAPAEQSEVEFLKHWDAVSHEYGCGQLFDMAYKAARAAWFARLSVDPFAGIDFAGVDMMPLEGDVS